MSCPACLRWRRGGSGRCPQSPAWTRRAREIDRVIAPHFHPLELDAVRQTASAATRNPRNGFVTAHSPRIFDCDDLSRCAAHSALPDGRSKGTALISPACCTVGSSRGTEFTRDEPKTHQRTDLAARVPINPVTGTSVTKFMSAIDLVCCHIP